MEINAAPTVRSFEGNFGYSALNGIRLESCESKFGRRQRRVPAMVLGSSHRHWRKMHVPGQPPGEGARWTTLECKRDCVTDLSEHGSFWHYLSK